LNGKIFSKTIPKPEILKYRQQYKVISTQLKAGELSIRILADSDPLDGFVPVYPDLEDVYFTSIGSKVDINTL